MKYRRVLLKLSGEWLANRDKKLSIDYDLVTKLGKQIKKIIDKKIQVVIVIGGGNLWRGSSAEKNGIPRSKADYIGMLATLMNALAMQSILELQGLKVRVLSSIGVDSKIAEPFILEKANKYLEQGKIVIMAAGTGRPYFTTDTAATLLASEIKSDVLLLGKNNVYGIYDSDPNLNPNAKHFKEITYDKILEKQLQVMDSTAVAMARDNNIKLLVFNIGEENSIINTLEGKGIFTIVKK
ncbi:MAG: UMP kinase [Mycoplasmataceae bacterium]|nr:UMP kinase [Mycoplasmataceae bacterium]MBR2055741.1 UMP kinase [Mycoplasmataceae bacterium]MBR2999098.1 UMP kinase [Mycoplasmataceae bacterium]